MRGACWRWYWLSGRGRDLRQPVLALALTAVVALIALLLVRPHASALLGRADSGCAARAYVAAGVVISFRHCLGYRSDRCSRLIWRVYRGRCSCGRGLAARTFASRAIEPLTTTLLLPLFFAYAGLRTEVGSLSREAWFACGLVLIAAVAGKFGAVSAAARIQGFAWRDSVALGALMNTRGLMELVVLNIGYDLGILSPPMYTMMVIMALATTCMAGPVVGRACAPTQLHSSVSKSPAAKH